MKPIEISLMGGLFPDYLPMSVPEGGLITCSNILPRDTFLTPTLTPVAYSSNAVADYVRAMREFRDSSGTYYTFVGTTTKLYRLETTKSFSDITRVADPYNTGANAWHFEQYGQWIIATNYADEVQVLKGLTAANFVDLAGSPPNAKYVLFNNGHLVLGNLASYPKKVIWSANEDVEDWTPSLTTGAGSQDLSDADGDITGLAPIGNSFVIGHENALSVAHYVGSPWTFSITGNAVRNVGALPGSMVSLGNIIYFLSKNDVCSFDGNSVQFLGDGIRESLAEQMGYLTHRITSTFDVSTNTIFWSFNSTGAAAESLPNYILAFNYKIKKFSVFCIAEHNCINIFHTPPILLDAMDTLYPEIEDIPYPVDSPYWNITTTKLACIDTDKKLATFTGSSKPITLRTGEISTDGILHVNQVRPIVQGLNGDMYVSIGHRMSEADVPTYTTPSPVKSNGFVDVRCSGRYLSCKITTSDTTNFTGIDRIQIYGKQVGLR